MVEQKEPDIVDTENPGRDGHERITTKETFRSSGSYLTIHWQQIASERLYFFTFTITWHHSPPPSPSPSTPSSPSPTAIIGRSRKMECSQFEPRKVYYIGNHLNLIIANHHNRKARTCQLLTNAYFTHFQGSWECLSPELKHEYFKI